MTEEFKNKKNEETPNEALFVLYKPKKKDYPNKLKNDPFFKTYEYTKDNKTRTLYYAIIAPKDFSKLRASYSERLLITMGYEEGMESHIEDYLEKPLGGKRKKSSSESLYGWPLFVIGVVTLLLFKAIKLIDRNIDYISSKLSAINENLDREKFFLVLTIFGSILLLLLLQRFVKYTKKKFPDTILTINKAIFLVLVGLIVNMLSFVVGIISSTDIYEKIIEGAAIPWLIFMTCFFLQKKRIGMILLKVYVWLYASMLILCVFMLFFPNFFECSYGDYITNDSFLYTFSLLYLISTLTTYRDEFNTLFPERVKDIDENDPAHIAHIRWKDLGLMAFHFINLDKTIIPTLKELFLHPGELTHGYIDNKKRDYTNPVKLLLFVGMFYALLVICLPPQGLVDYYPTNPHSGFQRVFQLITKNKALFLSLSALLFNAPSLYLTLKFNKVGKRYTMADYYTLMLFMLSANFVIQIGFVPLLYLSDKFIYCVFIIEFCYFVFFIKQFLQVNVIKSSFLLLLYKCIYYASLFLVLLIASQFDARYEEHDDSMTDYLAYTLSGGWFKKYQPNEHDIITYFNNNPDLNTDSSFVTIENNNIVFSCFIDEADTTATQHFQLADYFDINSRTELKAALISRLTARFKNNESDSLEHMVITAIYQGYGLIYRYTGRFSGISIDVKFSDTELKSFFPSDTFDPQLINNSQWILVEESDDFEQWNEFSGMEKMDVTEFGIKYYNGPKEFCGEVQIDSSSNQIIIVLSTGEYAIVNMLSPSELIVFWPRYSKPYSKYRKEESF